MYSNSQSFLGGGNSARPNAQQFGQPQYYQQQQQQQQQQPAPGFQQQGQFAPQPTGFQQSSLQPQATGYPLQQQATSYPSQIGGFQAQPTGFQNQVQQSQPQLPQATGYGGFQQHQTPQQLQPPSNVPSAKTGQTSSQIAASFGGLNASAAPKASPSNAVKIPKIRLSFLTAQDQAKFEQLFKSAVGSGQALSGDKVRDLLIRSKLPGNDLSNIWILSDTTKSGQLLFPEFALAMYLCNLRLVGKELPHVLPENIKNEVSSMVDIISFGIPDDAPPAPVRSNIPNFDISSSPISSTPIQQPQPQLSNQQLLAQITSQPTGFASQYIPPQPTGFQQPLPQPQPGQTGFGNQNQVGYQGPRPPMPPMPTGFGQPGPALPLNAQPTGRPGQWGLVNAPSTGLPNIEALQARMMPQVGREGGFTTVGLSGNATVPWAITKEEKKLYDQVFKAWDGFGRGFIGGDTAIEVMGQSGLDKVDLEKIWTLCDPNNRGKLDLDEFAVAMHLIYRKLNGYPIPGRLPPELVPPSTRNLDASIGHVKSLLSQESETRRNTGAFLQPQKTGVSYLKAHSFRGDSNGITGSRKDATVFRNNDDDIGYKSSARRRVGGGGRSGSPALSDTPSSDPGEPTLDQLRKRVKEKRVLLDAMDFQGENDAEEDDALDRKDRYEADELYRRIRRTQEDIDAHPSSALNSLDSGAERRSLKRQLQNLTDRLPELASNVRKTERSISDAKLELFRLKDAKVHPNSAAAIVGTGPGGMVTEQDRLKARAKAMMQQRSAALSGRAAPGGDDFGSATKRLEEGTQRVENERGTNERMIKDVEDSVTAFSQSLSDSLRGEGETASTEHERRRWEDALGVEDEVRDFIFDLQRNSRATKVRKEERPRETASTRETSTPVLAATKTESPPTKGSSSAGKGTSTSTYSSYKTAEDRAAFIKQQAEQRMAERLAALGLKAPAPKSSSPVPQKSQNDSTAEQRRKLAEEEDAKREKERQSRLAEEGIAPPTPPKATVGKSKPPPPPTRGSRSGTFGQQAEAKRKAEEEAAAARAKEEQEAREKMLKKEQEAQAARTRELEDETRQQEDELAKEKEAAEARLKELQRQYEQGRLKKQEEKKRKQAAESAAKEKEARLAAQRAELEAARERERKLQQQLEALADEESSDEEAPGQLTPKDSTPSTSRAFNSQASSTVMVPPAEIHKSTETPEQPLPPQHSSSYSSDTNNPFFQKINQSTKLAASTPPTASAITSPGDQSTNPFRGLAQQQAAAAPLTAQATGGLSRRRPEEDEWSVVDSSNGDSSDDEDGPPVGGSAKHLASMLFGSMGPPRPLSAMDDKKSPATPTAPAVERFASPPPAISAPDTPTIPSAPPPPPAPPAISSESAAPPPAPPMPGAFPGGPPTAPPPPPGGPPPPPMGIPPPPPPPAVSSTPAGPPRGGGLSALLGDIQKGTGLKKTVTKDRSQASVAGRVLN